MSKHMKLEQLPIKDIELVNKIVRVVTPYILEYNEVKDLVQDILDVYKEKINSSALSLGELRREANADTYPVNFKDKTETQFNIIYDIEETRLTFETQNDEEAMKMYRILREQRIITPDLNYIRENLSGNLTEFVAALLWQIGSIKVSLGDLKPLFKVDERKNRSPIYIDVKCLPNYPAVNDFIISQATLLLSNLDFDLICGVEAGSISFAALLAKEFAKPMFFARKEKHYPEASLFEGIRNHELFRKKVLLVDDTLVKGWTKERVISEIRKQGGFIEACFVIFDREQGGREALAKLGVRLYSLTNRQAALSKRIPRAITFITDSEYDEINEYFESPLEWHKEKNLAYYELTPKKIE
ncbi:MAG: phosphoribosyltransferase family protein [candidate division WOR-3 bacterium]|nr:phosphoribosyltransferase family protein [candidate division WOR-3 bacterium]MDH5683033.1 phosphoribosyltransferase family protein [candidate division WOR-3 bacterium]